MDLKLALLPSEPSQLRDIIIISGNAEYVSTGEYERIAKQRYDFANMHFVGRISVKSKDCTRGKRPVLHMTRIVASLAETPTAGGAIDPIMMVDELVGPTHDIEIPSAVGWTISMKML